MLMKGTVLFQKRRRAKQPIGSAAAPDKGWMVVAVAGAALALVGWTDALLLWFPANFSDPEWEFATTSTFFDALPLGTIGLVAVAAAALNRSSRPVLLTLAVLFPLLFLFFVGAAGLFALATAAAWGDVEPALRPVLERIVVKTSILSATYLALYAWVGWTVARSGRRSL
jgi:hypothetical protein